MLEARDGLSPLPSALFLFHGRRCAVPPTILIFVPHTRARELQAEHFVDEITLIADDGRNDFMERVRQARRDGSCLRGVERDGVLLVIHHDRGLGTVFVRQDALDDPLTRGNPDFRALKVFAIGVDELRAVLALALNEAVSPVASAMSVISSTKCSACISRARMRRVPPQRVLLLLVSSR